MAPRNKPVSPVQGHDRPRLIQYLILIALIVAVAGGSDWLRATYAQSPSSTVGSAAYAAVHNRPLHNLPFGERHGMASNHIPSAQAVTLRAVSVIVTSLGDNGRLKRRLHSDSLCESRSGSRQIRAGFHPVTCRSGIHSSLARTATLVGAKPSGTG